MKVDIARSKSEHLEFRASQLSRWEQRWIANPTPLCSVKAAMVGVQLIQLMSSPIFFLLIGIVHHVSMFFSPNFIAPNRSLFGIQHDLTTQKGGPGGPNGCLSSGSSFHFDLEGFATDALQQPRLVDQSRCSTGNPQWQIGKGCIAIKWIINI